MLSPKHSVDALAFACAVAVLITVVGSLMLRPQTRGHVVVGVGVVLTAFAAVNVTGGASVWPLLGLGIPTVLIAAAVRAVGELREQETRVSGWLVIDRSNVSCICTGGHGSGECPDALAIFRDNDAKGSG